MLLHLFNYIRRAIMRVLCLLPKQVVSVDQELLMISIWWFQVSHTHHSSSKALELPPEEELELVRQLGLLGRQLEPGQRLEPSQRRASGQCS